MLNLSKSYSEYSALATYNIGDVVIYLNNMYVCKDKGLHNRESLFRDMQVAWKKIEQRYASVNKDENNVMTVKKINYI